MRGRKLHHNLLIDAPWVAAPLRPSPDPAPRHHLPHPYNLPPFLPPSTAARTLGSGAALSPARPSSAAMASRPALDAAIRRAISAGPSR
eukprot:313627-Chlamydomonas_euryale.AAC.1